MNNRILKYSSYTFLNPRDKSFQTLPKLKQTNKKKLNSVAIQPMKDLCYSCFLDLRFRGAKQHVSRPGYNSKVEQSVFS